MGRRLISWPPKGYDRLMSISTSYASTETPSGLAIVPSGLAIVPSGETASLSAEQAIMLNDRLKSEVSLYKGVAVGGLVLAAGVATFALVQRVLMNQKLSLARAEGAAVGYTPRGQQNQPFGAQSYGYPPAYYR